MAAAPKSTSPSANTIDLRTGRLLPLTEEQRRARSLALARSLDEIDKTTDETDTDEIWRDMFRSIDEGRPDAHSLKGSIDPCPGSSYSTLVPSAWRANRGTNLMSQSKETERSI